MDGYRICHIHIFIEYIFSKFRSYVVMIYYDGLKTYIPINDTENQEQKNEYRLHGDEVTSYLLK